MPAKAKPGLQPTELRRRAAALLLIGFKFRHPTVEFLFDALASVAILFLNHADQLVELAADPLQVVVGDAPSVPHHTLTWPRICFHLPSNSSLFI